MITHAQAYNYASLAITKVIGHNPTAAEVLMICGVALLETGYGAYWTGAGVGSNNVGGIQYSATPCDPLVSFPYTDHHSDGTVYSVCFRKYPDMQSGFNDLVHELYTGVRQSVLAAATAGSVYGVAKAMRETSYYEGYGATDDEKIALYFLGLNADIMKICYSLSKPMPDGTPVLRTLRLDAPMMHGDDVKRVQRAVQVKDDGWYGPVTTGAVKGFQSAHKGLAVDGVVGNYTWSEIILLGY